jgi:hypothetical protein
MLARRNGRSRSIHDEARDVGRCLFAALSVDFTYFMQA